MNLPDISFIIPSTARGPKIGALIEDFIRFAAQDIEVIVVANGASAVSVTSLRERFAMQPWVKIIECDMVGLTYARVAGAKASRRPFVWFLDDDVRLPPHFLPAISQLQVPPLCGFGGGPTIQPQWIQLPDWVFEPIMKVDLSIIEGKRATNAWPIGANCFCRKEALDAVIEEMLSAHYILDRQGANLLSCGDTYLWILLTRRGWHSFFSGDIAVFHDIATDRLEPRWFAERAKWQGLSTLCLYRNLGLGAYLWLSIVWSVKAGALWLWGLLVWATRQPNQWPRRRMFLITSQVYSAFLRILFCRPIVAPR